MKITYQVKKIAGQFYIFNLDRQLVSSEDIIPTGCETLEMLSEIIKSAADKSDEVGITFV